MAKKKNITLESLDSKFDRVIDAMATKEDIERLDKRIDSLEQKFDKRFQQVLVAIDGLVKVVTDMQLEYAAISARLERYEEWFKILAKKTGVKLPI